MASLRTNAAPTSLASPSSGLGTNPHRIITPSVWWLCNLTTGSVCVTATLKRTENRHQGCATEISASASSCSGTTSRLHIRASVPARPAEAELSADSDSSRATGRLSREHHRIVRECLQLDSISGRIEEEASRLLARKTLEADLRLDDETDAGLAELRGERFPLRHAEDHPKVPHRHILSVHLVGRRLPARLTQVRHDLVAVEVEVHPLRRGAPFRTTEQVAIETARLGQVAHGKSEMKARYRHVLEPQCAISRRSVK